MAGRDSTIGVDIGATLAKLARQDARDGVCFELLPAEAVDAVAERIRETESARVGLTGAGAAELSRRLDGHAGRVNEFAAWGTGATALLERGGDRLTERHLIVSVGTGTSVLLADGLSVTRIGGTGLGGGTLLGLASALLGTDRFDEIVALAAAGSRSDVDLLVSDIYRAGEIALAGHLTAANFGKLGRARGAASREDLADALMGLVGENVALVCGGLAAAAQVSTIVFAGSTLRHNTRLTAVLREITTAFGRRAVFLRDGEFAGAYGALLLTEKGAGKD